MSRSDDQQSMQVARIAVSGIEDLREAVKGAALSVVQLQRGQMSGQLLHAALGGTTVSIGAFSHGIRVRGSFDESQVTLGMLLGAEGEVSQWNFDTVAGDVLTFPDGSDEDGSFAGASSYMTLALPMDDLLVALRGYDAFDGDQIWRRAARYRPSPSSRDASLARIRTCVQIIGRQPRNLSCQAMRLLQVELLDCYATSIASRLHGERDWPGPPASSIVRAVEDYLEAMGAIPVHVNELCVALNLSRRSLHRAFKAELGIGPLAYVRLNRMSQIRHALIDAAPHQTTVTRVALDHGFWELGRFAITYRQLFGERPSATLARPAQTSDTRPSSRAMIQKATWLARR